MKFKLVLCAIVLLLSAASGASAGSINLTGTLAPGGPVETQVAIISTPNCTGAYTVFQVLYAAYSFTVDTTGVYTFSEPGAESAMYVYDVNFDPDFPADHCLAATNTNPLSIPVNLTAGTLYYVVVIEDTFAQDGMDYSITMDGPGNISNCIFGDDFLDSVVDWLVLKPTVIETGGDMILVPTAAKAEINASSVFAGCSTCSTNATLRTAGGLGNKVWLLSWYTDKKNAVELLFKEEKDVVVLKQRSNGSIVAKGKAIVTINPNTSYNVVLGFDGIQFTVTIDGNPVLALPAAAAPFGVPGFRAKRTTGTMHSVCVD